MRHISHISLLAYWHRCTCSCMRLILFHVRLSMSHNSVKSCSQSVAFFFSYPRIFQMYSIIPNIPIPLRIRSIVNDLELPSPSRKKCANVNSSSPGKIALSLDTSACDNRASLKTRPTLKKSRIDKDGIFLQLERCCKEF